METGVSVSTNTPKSRLSVSWVIEYMENRILAVEGKKRSTWNHYRSSLLMFQEIFGETYSLAVFNSTNIYDFQNSIIKTGKSPTTVNTYCRGMAAIFHRLKKSALVKENPFEEFEPVREPVRDNLIKPEERVRFLEEVDRLKDQNYARLLRILAYTGIRRSEVLFLHRDDVDLLNNRFQVTNIKSRKGEKRWLTIPPKVRGCFAYFLEHPGDYPFKICRPDCLGKWAKYCMTEAGLSYHTHSLRHTFITLSLKKGLSIRETQRIAGHKDAKTTELYAHDAEDYYETPDIDF